MSVLRNDQALPLHPLDRILCWVVMWWRRKTPTVMWVGPISPSKTIFLVVSPFLCLYRNVLSSPTSSTGDTSLVQTDKGGEDFVSVGCQRGRSRPFYWCCDFWPTFPYRLQSNFRFLPFTSPLPLVHLIKSPESPDIPNTLIFRGRLLPPRNSLVHSSSGSWPPNQS